MQMRETLRRETKKALAVLSTAAFEGTVFGLLVVPVCCSAGQTSKPAGNNAGLPEAVARLRAGRATPYDLETIAKSEDKSPMVDVERQFGRTSDRMEKAKLAEVLVRLKDPDQRYWNYLLRASEAAVELQSPSPVGFDSQGNAESGLAPAFLDWQKHHQKLGLDAAQDAVYNSPGTVMLLGSSLDPRATPTLRRGLDSGNYLIQAASVEGLAARQDRSSVPRIIHACETSPHEVAKTLATYLAYFDDPDAQREALKYLSSKTFLSIRQRRLQGRTPYD